MARALSYGYHITVPYITVYRNRLLQAIQLAVLDLEEGHAPDPFPIVYYCILVLAEDLEDKVVARFQIAPSTGSSDHPRSSGSRSHPLLHPTPFPPFTYGFSSHSTNTTAIITFTVKIFRATMSRDSQPPIDSPRPRDAGLLRAARFPS